MARKPQALQFVKGRCTARRTEANYLQTMLDAVTLDDWREVITATVQAAKEGDATARGFLASYLVGKPGFDAARPVTVVVNALAGRNELAERLAKPIIDREQFPILHRDDDWKESVTDAVAEELQRLEEPTS